MTHIVKGRTSCIMERTGKMEVDDQLALGHSTNRVTYAAFAKTTSKMNEKVTALSALFPDLQVQQDINDHNINHKLPNVRKERRHLLL